MVAVFSPFAIAADPWYSVKLSYLTDILQAEDGTEQRVMLRVIPVREHSFVVRTIATQNTGWLDALTYGNQNGQMAIPHWPHGTFLSANVSAGSIVVLAVADTSDRDFVVGGYAVVWQDDGHAEECTISTVSSTSVTVITLVNSYTRGAFVIPSYRGRMKGDLDLSRFHASMAEVPVTFTMEHQADPDVAIADADVFSTVPYMRVEVSHALTRQVDRVESATYTYADYPTRSAPIGARPFKVWVNSRSAANSLIDWFESVRGRNRAFYLPTYQDDLRILSGLSNASLLLENGNGLQLESGTGLLALESSSTSVFLLESGDGLQLESGTGLLALELEAGSLTIERCGYTEHMFPLPERKVLAAIQPNGTVTRATVTAAVDNGFVTDTESLTLDTLLPVGTSLLSYMLYGRLESDTLELKWQNNYRALCELGFVECPAELAPTEFEAPPPDQAVGPPDPLQCTATVPNGQDEVPTLFTVFTRDANGLFVRTGGHTVVALVTGANTATPTITDLENGTYRGSYTPHNLGTDLVAITFDGVAIRGSPYTSIVGNTPVIVPHAMPFGFSYFQYVDLNYVPGITEMTRGAITPNNVNGVLAQCRAAGAVLSFGWPRDPVRDSAGHFSLSRFMDFTDQVADVIDPIYVANGTAAQHRIIDDADAGHWGGRAPTLREMGDACAYSQSVWPTIPAMIRRAPDKMIGIENLDIAVAQYDAPRHGDVTAFRAKQERAATTIGCDLQFGLNTLDGGMGESGVRGEGEWWMMSASEITRYGRVLIASDQCVFFNCWRFHNQETRFAAHYNDPAVKSAIAGLASLCSQEVR